MFTVPGRTVPLPYPGCVDGPVTIQFSADISITLSHLRLVNHGRPLAILGADVWCQGACGDVEFVGMGPGRLQGARHS